jgi:hypothetical protein
MKRCPQCRQKIPAPIPVRICGKCKNPILLHDKWFFKFAKNGKNVQMRHRHCDNPEEYMSKKEQYASF